MYFLFFGFPPEDTEAQPRSVLSEDAKIYCPPKNKWGLLILEPEMSDLGLELEVEAIPNIL